MALEILEAIPQAARGGGYLGLCDHGSLLNDE